MSSMQMFRYLGIIASFWTIIFSHDINLLNKNFFKRNFFLIFFCIC